MIDRRIQKNPHWLLILAIGLIVTGLAAPLVVQVAIPPPVRFTNLPFPASGPVRVGDVVPIEVERCSTESEPVVAVRTRALQEIDTDGNPTNDHRYILPADSALIPPGCSRFLALSASIPAGVVPGVYRLEGVSTVRGRWKTVDLPWQTEPFEIVE